MKVNSLILQEYQDVQDMRSMVEVYQEIAAMRLSFVKDAMLASRQYYESLAVLVREVRPWLRVQSPDCQDQNSSNYRKTSQKTALFFSANTGLYGDIIADCFRDFLRYVTKEQVPCAVVGAAGRRMMDEAVGHPSYRFFPCDDSRPEAGHIAAIVGYARSFDHAEIFHGRFINLVSQVPYRSSLSGAEAVDAASGAQWQKTSRSYVFEPSTEDIQRVVEGEVLASVVEQLVHESNFSKFASRMMHLDRAIQNIDERIKSIERERRTSVRREEQKKQLARMSGRSLWES